MNSWQRRSTPCHSTGVACREDSVSLSRRALLSSSLGLALALAAPASSQAAEDHHHHHPVKHKLLIESALDCIGTAQLCREHCLLVIRSGDNSLVDCLDAVNDTIAICETLVQLAASDSPHLAKYATVCIDVCKDCEEECRKHRAMHKECEDCMLSCQDCIDHLKKIAV